MIERFLFIYLKSRPSDRVNWESKDKKLLVLIDFLLETGSFFFFFFKCVFVSMKIQKVISFLNHLNVIFFLWENYLNVIIYHLFFPLKF